MLLAIMARGQQRAEPKPDPQVERYNKLIGLFRYDNPDSAIFYVNKGLDLTKRTNDSFGRAMILNQLGMINDNRGLFHESRDNYLEAFSLYKALGQTKGMATETIRLGVVEMRKGNYDKAIGYFLEALRYSESINEPKGIMEANITLGEAYMGQRKYDVAIQYLKIAEKINDTLPLSNLSLNLFNDFGVAYRETARLEEAKDYLEKGIEKSNIKQYQGLNITLINNLASVYAKEGNTNYSIKLQKTALQKAINIHNYIRQLQTLNGLATSYRDINADSSLSYLYRAKALAEGRLDYKQVIEALQGIAELYKKKGNFEAAMEAKEEEYNLADKYFYKEMSKQVTSLQAQYELSKSKVKVQELNFLNSRQKLERRIILAVAASAIIVLLILAYSDFKNRSLNGKLLKANKSLDESNKVKDKLFSVLGHDLRSPFVSVINLLELIDDDDIPADAKSEMIKELTVSSKAALETLTGLLKWGEMQIKGLRINQQEFAVKPVAERVITLLNGNASYKNIGIINGITTDLNLIADPDHVEFILRNLISNAIKFTGVGGKVTVDSFYSAAGNTVTITVKDTGVGMSAEKLESIFSLNNISSNGTFNEKGTSLGLLMCKEFVEANKGTITVRSTPGYGSEFAFTLKGAVNKAPSKNKTGEKSF